MSAGFLGVLGVIAGAVALSKRSHDQTVALKRTRQLAAAQAARRQQAATLAAQQQRVPGTQQQEGIARHPAPNRYGEFEEVRLA